jgi:hypothetical protein
VLERYETMSGLEQLSIDDVDLLCIAADAAHEAQREKGR